MRLACRFLTVTAFMLVLSGQGWAQVVSRHLSREVYTRLKPAVEEPTARVAEQIRALGDESAATRRNARQALLAMGASIQPQLRRALEAENKNKEANPATLSRARAELMVLISTLDDERYAKTSMVTLHRKDAPLVDTLREFGVQVDASVKIAGNTLADRLEWLDSAKVSLDIEKLDYWSSLRAIREQLGFTTAPAFIEDLPHLIFHRPRQNEGYSRGDPKQMPYDVERAIVAGPLLIAPSPLDTRGQNLVLTLLALPEARLADKLQGSAGNHAILQIDEYTDDRGQSLLPSDQPLVFGETSLDPSNDAERLWKWRIEALLPRPAAGRRIGSLKGRFGVSTGPPQTEVVAVDLTRGTGQLFEFDGISVLVTSVVPSESTYTVTGEMRAPTNSPMGRRLMAIGADDGFGLRDKTGAEIRRDTGPTSVRSEAGVTTMFWTLNGRALRKADGIVRSAIPTGGMFVQCTANCVPAALMWLTPNDTHWIQTPFELRDIPLPAPGR